MIGEISYRILVSYSSSWVGIHHKRKFLVTVCVGVVVDSFVSLNHPLHMQEQMKELLLKVTPNKKNDGWKKPGCQNCQDNNTVATCRHCWKCGEEGHKAQEKDKCKEGK